MRWCILPAHTHSQIRLDPHESNAKSADPRARARNPRARATAVELVFSPRKTSTTVYNSDRNQQNRSSDTRETSHFTQGYKATRAPFARQVRARDAPWARVPTTTDTQSKSKLALVHERATPRAHTLLNTRACARVRACACARAHTYIHIHTRDGHVCTRKTRFTLFAHLKHTRLHSITHATDM